MTEDLVLQAEQLIARLVATHGVLVAEGQWYSATVYHATLERAWRRFSRRLGAWRAAQQAVDAAAFYALLEPAPPLDPELLAWLTDFPQPCHTRGATLSGATYGGT